MGKGCFVRIEGVIVLALVLAAGAEAGTYYVSPDGNNGNPGTEELPWKTVQKAANTLNAGDTALIKDGTYRELVTVTRSGITLERYAGQSPVIDGNGMSGGSGILVIRDCNHIRIAGLHLSNATSLHTSGIWTWNVDDITIENCHVYNTASSGIKVNESRNVVIEDSEVEAACESGGEEDISIKLHSDTVLVRNNHIHDANHEGIDIKEGARNVQVIGNHIYNVERQGLYADAWNQPTYNIEFNGNIIHDCDFGMGACSEMGGLLSNVRFVNNLVYDCNGPGMFCKDWGGGPNHPMEDIYYVNNTAYNCAWGWGAGMDIGTYEAINVVVRNNILSQCRIVIQVNREPISKIIEKNLCENAGGLDPNWVIAGQPRFVNPGAGDFHLLGDSDAIDAGLATDAPGLDLDGKARPQGIAIDIGAYEHPSGDIDGDGYVDFVDFAILGGQWQQAGGTPSADIAPEGGDGVVDLLDLDRMAECWAK